MLATQYHYAAVAQLVRVSACHAEGRGFESHLPLMVFSIESSSIGELVTISDGPQQITCQAASLLDNVELRLNQAIYYNSEDTLHIAIMLEEGFFYWKSIESCGLGVSG